MKTDLLLLHGALGSKQQLEPLKELLSDQFNIYSLNFDGHGGNASDNHFSIDLFTDNLIHFLEKNELRDVYIFGYSMGGYVALNAAHQRPDLVQKIVTLGTKFDWSPESAAQEIKMLNPEKIEEKVPQFATRLKELHEPVDWKLVMNKTASLMRDLGEGKGLKDEEVENVKQEVVIGLGDKDKMVGMDESQKVVNLLPNGSFMVLEGVPHPIDMISNDQLVAYILNA